LQRGRGGFVGSMTGKFCLIDTFHRANYFCWYPCPLVASKHSSTAYSWTLISFAPKVSIPLTLVLLGFLDSHFASGNEQRCYRVPMVAPTGF